MEREDELELDASIGDYEVIPRPQEMIQAQVHSISSKENLAKEISLKKKLIQKKKDLLSLKEKLSSKTKKKDVLKAKSRLSQSISKPSKSSEELQQKFDSYVQGAKKSIKTGNLRSEVTKSIKDDSEKIKSSPSKDDTSKQELQLLKNMEEAAETAQERYDVLNARDSYLRLKESKKDETKLKKVSGTCPDMCPEKERYSRIAKNCLAIYETKMAFDPMGSSKDVDHSYMVKEYSRSSADQQEPLPHELRPVSVLKFTMDYMICNIIDRKNTNISIADWYDFIWNRTRSIRKDITQQQLCDVECVEILEKCARFHILCAELLSEEDTATFDPKINNENLTKCLQTLKHMYHDLQTKGIQCANEAEFRAYDILLSLTEGETLRLVKDIRKEVFNSPPVKTAFEAALAFKSNNYVKFFKLIEEGTYLDSCILHRYIPEARVHALQVIERAYCVPNNATSLPLMQLVKDLKFENVLDAANFCQWHGLTVDETHVTIQRQTFQKPSSGYPVARVTSLVENKLLTSLSEIVNNGPLPENPLNWYQPHDSFSEEGLLLNKFTVSDVSEKEKENIKGKEDIQSMDTEETIFIQPFKKGDTNKSRSIHESSKLNQKKLEHSVAKVSDFLKSKIDSSFHPSSKNENVDSLSNLKQPLNTSIFSQKLMYSSAPSPFSIRKSQPVTTSETTQAENFFRPPRLQDSVFRKSSSESLTFFNSSTMSPSFSIRSPLMQSTKSKEASTVETTQLSSSILNSPIPVTKGEIFTWKDISCSSKLLDKQEDFIEKEDLDDLGVEFETDMKEKTKEIEFLSDYNSMQYEKEVDEDSLTLAMKDEETLDKLREEKKQEIVTFVTEEIYADCIESLSAEISEAAIKEEWEEKLEYEDSLKKMRAFLARKTINKWRMFCERKKQRRMFPNTEPLSPWIPMLMNTQYVTSGASSPFSVYKKHCSLSRLTDTKLKQRDNTPGWEPYTSSQFEILAKPLRFPLSYLKKIGINRFFKLCIVFASYSSFSLSTFIDWMCKKFQLFAFPGNFDKKSNLLSFYTLNGGKTLMCIQAVILGKDMDLKANIILNGLSAMILCVPEKFPDSSIFTNFLEQYETLLKSNSHLLPFPLIVFRLESSEKMDVVNKLTSFLYNRFQSVNLFSTIKEKELYNIRNYTNNSFEVLNAIKWLIENQEQVPDVVSCSLRNYLEDSFASVFNALFWKLSLQEFKPLFQMPEQIISFYNKQLECRATLLCSNFLIATSKWWPPQELFTLQPEYRFIDLLFQRKSSELMKSLYLPQFVGDPYSLKDLWSYVDKFTDIVDSGQETLLISIQSILRISSFIDWPSIISKCAYFILCHYCTKIGKSVNEDVFYMKQDIESINLDSFWQTVLSALRENHSFYKRKIPECEPEENSVLKRIRKNENNILVEELHDINNEDEYTAPATPISEYPNAISCRVDNLLSSLKSALKKQNEESDEFMLKLNKSISNQSFSEMNKEDLSLTLDGSDISTYDKLYLDSSRDEKTFNYGRQNEDSSKRISSKPNSGIEEQKNSIQKLLGKKLPDPITSPSSLSEKLLELQYNIQRNKILEDNLGLLLKL